MNLGAARNVSFLFLLAASCFAQQSESKPAVPPLGAAAPALPLPQCVTGKAPQALGAGQVCLVEFWGPAPDFGLERRRDFERLLAAHAGKLQIVGVMHGTPTFGFQEVKEHYGEFGKDIGFCIGWDEGTKRHRTWPIAADDEPPVCFVVDQQGRLVWTGGFGFLGMVLPQVLAGEVDPDELATATDKLKQRVTRIYLVVGIKPEKAIEELEALLKDHAFLAQAILPDVFGTLLEGGHRDEAMKLAGRVCDQAIQAEDVQLLNGLAWTIVDPQVETKTRDLVTAERAVKKAVELSKEKNADILDTMARVCFCKQDFAGAVAWQKKAVALADDDDVRESLQQTLEGYEERVGKQ